MGGGARSAPLGVAMSKKGGCAQRTGAHARPKPTNLIYLSLGLHEEQPSYRRSLQPSKENIQHFKTIHFSYFFTVGTCWKFLGSNQFCWAIVKYSRAKYIPFPVPDQTRGKSQVKTTETIPWDEKFFKY